MSKRADTKELAEMRKAITAITEAEAAYTAELFKDDGDPCPPLGRLRRACAEARELINQTNPKKD